MSYRDLLLHSSLSIANPFPGQKAAVTVFGVPFDATATWRPGTRFAPNAIREAFQNIEIFSPQLMVDLEVTRIDDLGDLKHSADVRTMVAQVEKVTRELVGERQTPAILGGEHTLTYGAVRGLRSDTAVVIFDAHLDLRDSYDELRLMHATFLRRLSEERSLENVLHIGTRAASKPEWELAEKLQLSRIAASTTHEIAQSQKLLEDFLRDVKSIYVSVDLDVLDPAFAPGVSNPEPNGISTYELLQFLYRLRGKRIIGFDIVELCPPYDSGAAATAAARILAELTGLASLA